MDREERRAEGPLSPQRHQEQQTLFPPEFHFALQIAVLHHCSLLCPFPVSGRSGGRAEGLPKQSQGANCCVNGRGESRGYQRRTGEAIRRGSKVLLRPRAEETVQGEQVVRRVSNLSPHAALLRQAAASRLCGQTSFFRLFSENLLEMHQALLGPLSSTAPLRPFANPSKTFPFL